MQPPEGEIGDLIVQMLAALKKFGAEADELERQAKLKEKRPPRKR